MKAAAAKAATVKATAALPDRGAFYDPARRLVDIACTPGGLSINGRLPFAIGFDGSVAQLCASDAGYTQVQQTGCLGHTMRRSSESVP
jgi:hypothetical protein